MKTDFGLQVRWNQEFSIRITLTLDHKGKVCGLCGDYNDNDANDWLLGPNPKQCIQTINFNKTEGDRVSYHIFSYHTHTAMLETPCVNTLEHVS